MARTPHFMIAAMAGIFVLLSMSWAHANNAICDPNATLNDRAKSYRMAGRLDEADRTVQQILRRSPDDFRGNYNKGLIMLDRAHRGDTSRMPGIRQLVKTAEFLPMHGKMQACAKGNNFYSIYNTIGVEFYNLPDLKAAEKYFELANQYRNYLNEDTKAKLFDNLGLIQLRLKHDSGCAAAYFQESANHGLHNGSLHLVIAERDIKFTGESLGCHQVTARNP